MDIYGVSNTYEFRPEGKINKIHTVQLRWGFWLVLFTTIPEKLYSKGTDFWNTAIRYQKNIYSRVTNLVQSEIAWHHLNGARYQAYKI